MNRTALHILLSLAARDLHGYGIMQDVAQQSEGLFKPGPGIVYDNLQRMIERGVVEDARRRYYRLTDAGRNALSEEVTRLEEVVRIAKLHLQRS
jgi:DNA-binding PadR family transcriptional regulator